MTTSGLFSPTEVFRRVGAGDWVYDDDFLTVDGTALLQPTSINYVGTSASIVGRGSVEFSACTSLSLNGVFSNAYDNYTISIRATTSALSSISMRLRTGGTDNSTASSYVRQRLEAYGTTVTADRNTTDTFWGSIAYSDSVQRSGFSFFVFGPSLAQPTAIRSVNVYDYLNASFLDSAGTHNQSISYDGFTLFPTSSLTFTGLISVYGLVGA